VAQLLLGAALLGCGNLIPITIARAARKKRKGALLKRV
jgi:hypothetical protein